MFPRLHLRRRAVAPFALFAVAGLVGAGCQGATGVAASVNGHAISQSDLDSELHAILNNAGYVAAIQQGGQIKVKGAGIDGTFDLAFADRVLGRQILLELIHEEVVRRHIPITPDQLKAAADSERSQMGQDQLGKDVYGQFLPAYQALLAHRDAEVQALQNALSNVTIDDATIQKFYDDNVQKLFTQSCVSHILVPTQAQADQLHTQLVGGADFASLARQFSKDAGSATKGGDLGCNPPGTFVPEFEQAVQSLTVGQLSAVVHSQFGYHIIKVTDRKVTPLQSARAQIVQQLQNSGQAQLSQFVQNAVSKSKVTVNPRYGTFIKTGAQAGTIVPPNAPPPSAGGVTPSAPTTLGTAGTGGDTGTPGAAGSTGAAGSSGASDSSGASGSQSVPGSSGATDQTSTPPSSP